MNNKKKLENVLEIMFKYRNIKSEYYLESFDIYLILDLHGLSEEIYEKFIKYLKTDLEFRERKNMLNEEVELKERAINQVKKRREEIKRCLKLISFYNEKLSVYKNMHATGKCSPEKIKDDLKIMEKYTGIIKCYNEQIKTSKFMIKIYTVKSSVLGKRLVEQKNIDDFFILNQELL